MKRALSIVLAAIAVAVLGFVYLTKAGHVPADQPAMVEVNGSGLAALQAEFNAASGSLRVILLLSPT